MAIPDESLSKFIKRKGIIQSMSRKKEEVLRLKRH
jgi:hypothetical protein